MQRTDFFLHALYENFIIAVDLVIEDENIMCVRFTYPSDNCKVLGWLMIPIYDKDSYPALVYCRGGTGSYGSLPLDHPPKTLITMAKWGYVIIATQYRGGPGSDGRDEYGGKDINDVLNLIPILDAFKFVNPDQLGIIGASRGGMMVYKALTKTDRFYAAAIISGLADLFRNAKQRPKMSEVFREHFSYTDASLRERSAVFWPTLLSQTTPILLLHGDADDRVDVKDSIDLAKVLTNKNKLVIIAGGDHGLKNVWNQRIQYLQQWFSEQMNKDKKE